MEDHVYRPIIDFDEEETEPEPKKEITGPEGNTCFPYIKLNPKLGIAAIGETDDSKLLKQYDSEWKIVSRNDGGQMYEWHCLGYYSTTKTIEIAKDAICMILRQVHK